MSYFDKVDTILFVTSLSAYDQTMVEELATNRVTDSIALFKTVCELKLLENCGIILFLNKKDLFKKKVSKSPIATHFPEYQGIPLLK